MIEDKRFLVILLLALVFVTGLVRLAAAQSDPVAAPRVSASPEPTPEPIPGSVGAVPALQPGPPEVGTQMKGAAARFVERVGTWYASAPDDAPGRVIAAGYPADLAPAAAPLLDVPAREARTTIVYPQFGGLTEGSASVMVLARQQLWDGRGDRVREVLLDVRLERRDDGRWQVTSKVDPPRPPVAPARRGGPTDLGRAVLDNPRIRVPEPGRADIEERRVSDPILAVLDELGRTFRLDVQVLATGHPGTVFPTTRISNHAVGRAVDIRAVDGRPVLEIPRDDPVLVAVTVAAGRAGASEVGGPIDPVGRGFFTDDVHQDHLHLGITPGKPLAGAP